MFKNSVIFKSTALFLSSTTLYLTFFTMYTERIWVNYCFGPENWYSKKGSILELTFFFKNKDSLMFRLDGKHALSLSRKKNREAKIVLIVFNLYIYVYIIKLVKRYVS